MKVRALIWFTALLSMAVGAVIVYLVLSVPNDLRADALLRDARKLIDGGKNNEARVTLIRIVQQYPRTDAAAAATAALVSLADKEHRELARAVSALNEQNADQSKLLADLQKNVTEIKNTPPPKPVTVAKPPEKKPAPKKPAPKKRAPTRRRRG